MESWTARIFEVRLGGLSSRGICQRRSTNRRSVLCTHVCTYTCVDSPNDPTDAPAGGGGGLGDRLDDDSALTHAGECRTADVLVRREEDVLVDLVRHQDDVLLDEDLRQKLELPRRKNLASRVVRCVQQTTTTSCCLSEKDTHHQQQQVRERERERERW